jgi:hypothetical protein
MAISQSADIDVDSLISELAASLVPPQRAAFEAAARAALEAVNCSGAGAAYRVLAPLQRGYWDPPSDWATNAPSGPGSRRPSKLVTAEAIGRDDPRVGGRDRHRLRAV